MPEEKVRSDWRSRESIAAGAEAHRWSRSTCGPAKAVPLLQSSTRRIFSAGCEAVCVWGVGEAGGVCGL